MKPPEPAIVRRPELLRMIGGISTSTLYRWMSNGSFPRPLKLGPSVVAWKRSEIESWIEGRESA